MTNEEIKGKKRKKKNEETKPGREGTRAGNAEWQQRTGGSTGPTKAWTGPSEEKDGQGDGTELDKTDGAWTTEMAQGPHRWSVCQAEEAGTREMKPEPNRRLVEQRDGA